MLYICYIYMLYICYIYIYICYILNSGDVKPYRLGRPTGSASLFDHEESIHNGYILRTTRIGLHEIANYINSATGSSFRPQTLCHAVHMLGMTRKNVGH